MYCRKCGAELLEGGTFCIQCGAPVPSRQKREGSVVTGYNEVNVSGASETVSESSPDLTDVVITKIESEELSPELSTNPVDPPAVHYIESVEQDNVKSESVEAGEPVMKIGQYFGVLLLEKIPIINVILMLVWAFDDKKKNRANLCRAQILLFLTIFVVVIIAAGVTLYCGVWTFQDLIDSINSFWKPKG